MTDDTTVEGQASPADAESPPEPEDRPIAVDPLLVSLVADANSDRDYRLGMTLYVGGAVISGFLVSGQVFFESMLPRDDSGNLVDVNPNTLAATFRGIADNYQSATGQRITVWPEFIHLLDARVYTASGTIPSNVGIGWRGRIRAVDAWHLGELQLDPPEPPASA